MTFPNSHFVSRFVLCYRRTPQSVIYQFARVPTTTKLTAFIRAFESLFWGGIDDRNSGDYQPNQVSHWINALQHHIFHLHWHDLGSVYERLRISRLWPDDLILSFSVKHFADCTGAFVPNFHLAYSVDSPTDFKSKIRGSTSSTHIPPVGYRMIRNTVL